MSDLKDQVIGCIVGGAIGDAMGGPYEGRQSPVTIDLDAAWRISDDTQLTLATCEAIGHQDVVSPEAVANKFLTWYQQRRFTGVGASTLKALRDLEAGAHWALAGRKGEMAAGNGAAMRAAPLAFCLDPDKKEDRTLLRDICRITHHNDEAYVGALAVVRSIRAMVSSALHPSDNMLSQIAESLPDTNVRDALILLSKLPQSTPLVEVGRRFGCSGYVAESVPLAIFAAQRIGDIGLSNLFCEVIAVGGDTDTIASMTGQISGAWLGISQIPSELIEQLPEKDQIFDTAHKFADRLTEAG